MPERSARPSGSHRTRFGGHCSVSGVPYCCTCGTGRQSPRFSNIMNDISQNDLDDALARFLDGEPEPHDDRMLAAAMRSDKAIADEVRSLLIVDDLLRH